MVDDRGTDNSCQTDDPRRALLKVNGTTIEEKCAELGVIQGGTTRPGMLKEITKKYGIDVNLFHDEQIVRHSMMKDRFLNEVIPPRHECRDLLANGDEQIHRRGVGVSDDRNQRRQEEFLLLLLLSR
ncbi:hypothetical protein J2T58_000216 [Methanocalculus alkaliphilus]|uniref:hypothetical protein n=1 Tax=Methanocalculus alkaliphilus TaxID=768730 RepID=UPI00209E7D8A|nr:hypothetical protein [Methanocalculus alkaliphilus]MCP1714389.1 hypothetical protein [Methanocalculus alkaliphilus]